MNIGFERIFPTPLYPPGASRTLLEGRSWFEQSVVVTEFKKLVKIEFRKAQLGRCCFCRRVLFDDYATHIEHFIEKAIYGEYAFEIKNLSLSCGTCNIQKNARNKAFTAALKHLALRNGKMPKQRCYTLVQDILPGSPLPGTSEEYRWIHPHLDSYSNHIKIDKSWIFVGKTLKGTRTIRGVKLNVLALIEQRALLERLETRDGRLSILVAAMAELSHHRASEVASAVVKVLRRRRNMSTN